MAKKHRPYTFIYGQTEPPQDSVSIYARGVTYDPRSPVCTAPDRMWPGVASAGYVNRREKTSWLAAFGRIGFRAGVKGRTLRDHRRGAAPKGVV